MFWECTYHSWVMFIHDCLYSQYTHFPIQPSLVHHLHLSIHPFIHPSINPSVHTSSYPHYTFCPPSPFIHPGILTPPFSLSSIHPSICPHPAIFAFIHLVHLSINVSICTTNISKYRIKQPNIFYFYDNWVIYRVHYTIIIYNLLIMFPPMCQSIYTSTYLHSILPSLCPS